MRTLTWEEIDKELNEMVGCTEFKEFANNLTKLLQHMSCDRLDAFKKRAYVFSVNDGDGLSSQVRIINGILNNYIIEDQVRTVCTKLRYPKITDVKDSENEFEFKAHAGNILRDLTIKEVEAEATRTGREYRILVLDINEWLEKTDSEEFRAALSRLKDTLDDQMVIFRTNAIDRQALAKIEENISCYMDVQTVCTQPYSIDDYFEYAMRLSKEYDLEFDDESLKTFRSLLILERTNPGFWGFKSIRKMLVEIMFSALRRECESEMIYKESE